MPGLFAALSLCSEQERMLSYSHMIVDKGSVGF